MSAAPVAGSAERSSRERILDAACDLLAEEGFDGARIARIARLAGVSTALVHYHFDTREALLSEALEHAYDLAAAVRVDDRDPDAPGGTMARRLADFVERSLPSNALEEREWLLWSELELRAARDSALRPIAARMFARYRGAIADIVAEGIGAGEFADVDPVAVADIATGLIDGLGVRALLDDPAMPIDRARERIGGVLARELGVPGGALPFARSVTSTAGGGT